MATPSEQALEVFQINLTSKGQAKITPTVSSDVLKSICVLDNINVSEMARRTGINRRTAHNYTSYINSPNLDRFVRIMDKLGYSIHIVKHGTHETQ